MEISHPHQRELTLEEMREFDKFRAIIKNAITDGIITKDERDQIECVMQKDSMVTFDELELVRTLINDKVASGEITLDYS